MTAGNGPALGGKPRSPERTTGSPVVSEPSADRTRVPALANQTVPKSVAERVGFRSVSAGAYAP